MSINDKAIDDLIEENRLVNLPSTISKYIKIVEHKIKLLETTEPDYSLTIKVWIPKVIEEAIVEFIEEHGGLRADVITNSNYDSLVEIIDLKKRNNLFAYEKYCKIRKKIINKSKNSMFRTVKNVPLIFANALVIDLKYFEFIDVVIVGDETGDLWSKVNIVIQ